MSGRNFICKHMNIYVRYMNGGTQRTKECTVKTFTAALVHANINSSLYLVGFVCLNLRVRASVRAYV